MTQREIALYTRNLKYVFDLNQQGYPNTHLKLINMFNSPNSALKQNLISSSTSIQLRHVRMSKLNSQQENEISCINIDAQKVIVVVDDETYRLPDKYIEGEDTLKKNAFAHVLSKKHSIILEDYIVSGVIGGFEQQLKNNGDRFVGIRQFNLTDIRSTEKFGPFEYGLINLDYYHAHF